MMQREVEGLHWQSLVQAQGRMLAEGLELAFDFSAAGVNRKENRGGKKAAGENIFENDSIEEPLKDDTLQMEWNKLSFLLYMYLPVTASLFSMHSMFPTHAI